MSNGLIRTAVFLFLGILLVILPLVGCAKDDDITTENIENIIERVTAAATDIKTCRFDTSMEKEESSFEDDTETIVMNLSIERSVVVDHTNKKMHITYSMEHIMYSMEAGIADESLSKETEEYCIDDMWYGKTVTHVGAGPWRKHAIPADYITGYWEENNEVERQMRLLEGSEIESLGSEQVNGVECWVIKVIPDLENFWELEGMAVLPPPNLEESVKNISVRQWFAKDTYYLMRAEREWTFQMVEFLQQMSWKEVEFSHYNEPVSIVLPPEAEEAVEVE